MIFLLYKKNGYKKIPTYNGPIQRKKKIINILGPKIFDQSLHGPNFFQTELPKAYASYGFCKLVCHWKTLPCCDGSNTALVFLWYFIIRIKTNSLQSFRKTLEIIKYSVISSSYENLHQRYYDSNVSSIIIASFLDEPYVKADMPLVNDIPIKSMPKGQIWMKAIPKNDSHKK